MSKPCISKDNRKIGHSHPVSHSTGKTSDILWQEFELSHIVDSIPLFFLMFVPQNLLNTVYNGISAESSMYKDGWKEVNDVEMKKNWLN